MEMYKILSGKYDTAVTPQVSRQYDSITRGNDLIGRTKVEVNMICDMISI